MSDEVGKRIEAFLARPEVSNIEESDLDELVHDALDQVAARVSNAGPAVQAEVLRDGGFDPDALDDPDEMVHSILSTRASVINNGGRTEQVRALFEYGMDEASILEGLDMETEPPEIP